MSLAWKRYRKAVGKRSAHVRFELGKSYRYHYEGSTTLGATGTFRVKSEVLLKYDQFGLPHSKVAIVEDANEDTAVYILDSIVPLTATATENQIQDCRFLVHYYKLLVQHGGQEYQPNAGHRMDFSKWLSFSVSYQGEVKNVFYNDKDQEEVIALKKSLLGALSSKLVITDGNLAAKTRWGYEVKEAAHEGEQISTYHAEPHAEGIVFTKTRTSKLVDHADESHSKTIHYSPASGLPHKIAVKEHFIAPHKVVKGFEPRVDPDATRDIAKSEGHIDLSHLRGSGEVDMKLISVENTRLYKHNLKDAPKNLKKDTLFIRRVSQTPLPLEEIRHDIEGNLTCVERRTYERELLGANRCFHDLTSLLGRLSQEDLSRLTESYLYSSGYRNIFVDALADMATSHSYHLLAKHVFLAAFPDPDLIQQALIHFGDNEELPPKYILTLLEEMVFDKPYTFSDEATTRSIRSSATLALGSLVDQAKKTDPSWAEETVTRLHARTGVHDPYHHRQQRSTMTHEEHMAQVSRKNTDILALANAAMDSSFDLLCSYLNDTDEHIILRTSALHAVSQIKHQEAANTLLRVGLTDTEENVRRVAIKKYKEHELGGDVAAVLGIGNADRSRNITAAEHKRVKRSLKDSVSKIWQGFKFYLSTPAINWQLGVGDDFLGASVGLVSRNVIDIDVEPMEGHILVDIMDSAFATVNVGILGVHLDLLRAELCFYGRIRYQLNILKEYGFDEIKQSADLFNEKVAELVAVVQDTMEEFRGLVETYKGANPIEIVENLITAVKELPEKVYNLRTVSEELRKSVTNFNDLPPVIEEVKDLVDRVIPLFNDIKTDIMGLYNNISDPITVNIPWAIGEINSSFVGIMQAIPNLVENPKTAVQNIGREVARIAMACGVIVASKDKIANANIFEQDNRPHWQDLKSEIDEIMDEAKELKDKISDSIDSLKTNNTVSDLAKRFTGTDMATMKEQGLTDIQNTLVVELGNATENLKGLLEPFRLANQNFSGYVKNIKEAWKVLVEGYEEARTIIQMVFGPKTHEEFPKKYLESTTCGDGFWPSDGLGHYKEKGVDIDVSEEEEHEHSFSHMPELVSPFNGKLIKLDGVNKVAILTRDMTDVEVILENVVPKEELLDTEVGAGDPIGELAHPQHCDDDHIHFSMRKIGTEDYIDPSRYMEARDMGEPGWEQRCDHYTWVWMGKVKQEGSLTGGMDTSDETPDVPNAPDLSGLSFDPIEGTSISTFSWTDWMNNLNEFVKDLNLPDFSKIEDILSFDMKDIIVSKVLDHADKMGYSKLSNSITNLLMKVEDSSREEECVSPDRLADSLLKSVLELRGKDAEGPRTVLENRFKENEQRCFGIATNLGEDVYCHYGLTCLSVSCCVDLALFVNRVNVVASIDFDPHAMAVKLGLDRWTTTIPIGGDNEESWSETGIDESVSILKDFRIMNAVQLVTRYELQRVKNKFNVTLQVSWCSTRTEECEERIDIFRGVEITIPTEPTYVGLDNQSNNQSTITPRPLIKPNITLPSVEEMKEMAMGRVLDIIDQSGLNDSDIWQALQKMREAYQLWLDEGIKGIVIKIFENEFNRSEMCLKGIERVINRTTVTIWKTHPPFIIMIGPVPVDFTFGLEGFYGGKFSCKLCLLSMSGKADAVPTVGVNAYGQMRVKIPIYSAMVRVDGNIMTTDFPVVAEVSFAKLPLCLTMRLDLSLTPLILTLRGILEQKLPKKDAKEIMNWELWRYSTSSIEKNIFNLDSCDKAETAPEFSDYSQPIEDDGSGGQTGGQTTDKCHVEQLEGRDYTEPAVNIEIAVDDESSDARMTVSSGTYEGGRNLIDDDPLEGTSTILNLEMVAQQPVYFTITASNTQGLTSKATCHIDILDTSLPTGRVTPEFNLTSHPHIIRVSAYPMDDSPLIAQQASVGFGKGRFGRQLVDWHNVTVAAVSPQGITQDGQSTMEQFTNPRKGRLATGTFQTYTFDDVQACASACLEKTNSECRSFCYNDEEQHGECELFSTVEGNGVERHKSENFYYFERLGIPDVWHLRYEDLEMPHNTLIYVNLYLQNDLLYENIISSHGVLVDLTPPVPGPLHNVTQDDIIHDDCYNFVPSHLHYRCQYPTPAPNHRTLVEGDGSKTIFNGYESTIGAEYTRASRMISANWAGIHDDESGILMYSWAAGTAVCGDDISPHMDPHEHLENETDWRHVGVSFPLDLKDGSYYVSVRVINKVQFGGPLALTVCHAQPYILDTLPPLIYDVYDTTYDEVTHTIKTRVNASDPESGIKMTELALGLSKRDNSIMEWREVEGDDTIELHFQLPEGVESWLKVRVTNNVGLKAVGHATEPLFAGSSAPVAGTVYDGDQIGEDFEYQSSFTDYCANWNGFYDTQTGISKYIFGLGSDPGLDDMAAFRDLANTVTMYCVSDLKLKHKRTYYATVIAVNGGQPAQDVSASSSGVYIDNTGPEKGWVKDGKKNKDISYSSDTATIAAHFEDFRDPESGLKNLDLLVYRTHAGENSEEAMIHKEANLDKSADTSELHHFNLHHGDYIRVEVNATNGADISVQSASDGYTVDLTEPVLVALVDGTDITQDINYIDSTTSLSVSWNMIDDESGIDQYQVAAYELLGNSKTQIYPSSAHWETVTGNKNSYTTRETLQLKIGSRYCMAVSAVNGAGIRAIYDTDGVMVDPTPPELLWIHAGVQPGQSEELVDGHMLQTDLHGIRAEWDGFDAESGIEEYFVAIGTRPGRADVSDFRSMGKSKAGYIGSLELEEIDPKHDTPVYYVMVKAVNRAGKESVTLNSSPVAVVAGDIPGVVNIGPVVGDNIRYQNDRTTVTFNFNGFASALHGIYDYKWCLGTAPGMGDAQEYSRLGLSVIEDTDHSIIGIGGSGKGQWMVPLKPDIKYYVTVRATTGVGDILESSSDSFIVDESEPDVKVVKVSNKQTSHDALEDIRYQQEQEWYTASWEVEESETGLMEGTIYTLTSYPGVGSIEPPLSVSGNNLPYGAEHFSPAGRPNFLTLQTENLIGLVGSTVAPMVVIDSTPPAIGVVTCTEYVLETTDIRCSWQGFTEAESTVDHYMFGIGTKQGDDDFISFILLNYDQHTATVADIGVDLKNGDKYYATVVAVNQVGLSSRSFSKPIRVDLTPPQGGLVIELPDGHMVSADGGDLHELTDQCNNNAEICEEQDAICQVSMTEVRVSWEPFHDSESPIVKYEVALGSGAGMTDIRAYTMIHNTKTIAIIKGLDLSSKQQVFSTVRATNAAGLSSIATSNGVFISHTSGETSYVYDGNIQGVDIEYQNRIERVSANWYFSGDPCPIETYEWAVYNFDGTTVLPMETLPAGVTVADMDEFHLNDKESFYVVVKATNMLGNSVTLHSNGVTIQLEPLLPGVVRDGHQPGKDLYTQPSITTLSANWDGFGVDWYNENEATDDNQNIDGSIGHHQAIHHYEIAAGTERDSFEARIDIHPFVNVGLEKTWTLSDLELVPKSVVYYVTVRAYSVSGETAEVTSNGVRAGIEDDIQYDAREISSGEISVSRFIASAEEVSVSWHNFQFPDPIEHYRWGISDASLDGKTCQDFASGDSESIFNVYELSNVDLDTFVRANHLQMAHDTTYSVAVIATDESENCAMATEIFSVDLTPPVEGTMGVGPDFENATVLYTPYNDSVAVYWEDFYDNESDIDNFKLALYKSSVCTPPDHSETELIADFATVPGSSRDYTFLNVELTNNLIYFVHLVATNRAGTAITSISRPVLTDILQPSVGKIYNGHDFTRDVTWQSSSSSLEGVFLYRPIFDPDHCPFKKHPMLSLGDAWKHIIHEGIYMASEKRESGVTFNRHQVDETGEGTAITMVRDIRNEQMLSGAVQTNADIGSGGHYQFEIKAAEPGLRAVTSVVFWDGAIGTFGDLAIFDFDNFTQVESDSGQTVIVIKDKDDGDTSGGTPVFRWGLGIQIHTIMERDFGEIHNLPTQYTFKNVTYENVTSHYAVLWTSTNPYNYPESNTTEYAIEDLGFDPSEDWHHYSLIINPDNKEDDWDIELIVDGIPKLLLGGGYPLSADTQVQLGVYNRLGWVPELNDIFNPPETTAAFRNISFPPDSDVLCRYGNPFDGGEHPIVEFYAAVGKAAGETDVAPYEKVGGFCAPCSTLCPEPNCDTTCSLDETQEVKISLEDLNMDPLQPSNNTQPYYIIVKAVTGSGREVSGSSTGIYIDETPPEFAEMYHVDRAWDEYESSEYQSDMSTISAYWEVDDLQSGVVKTWWSIYESGHEHSPLQNLTEVDTRQTEGFAWNDQLDGLIQNGKRYAVTVICQNKAGLNATKKSDGIRVEEIMPIMRDAHAYINSSIPIGTTGPSLYFDYLHYQDWLPIVWNRTKTHHDTQEISIHVAVDTPGKSDIYSRSEIGYFGDDLHDGCIEWTATEVIICNQEEEEEEIDSNEEVEDRTGGNETSYYMEPGRVLLLHLMGCSGYHWCEDIPVQNIIIKRNESKLWLSSGSDTVLDMTITLSEQSVEGEVHVSADAEQGLGKVLVGGILNEEDILQEYTAEGATEFKPYIVDPEVTKYKTNRDLKHRISSWHHVNFYLSTLPEGDIEGPLYITAPFDTTLMEDAGEEYEPRLLTWCTEMEIWVDAGASCTDNVTTEILNGQLAVQVCSLTSQCEQQATHLPMAMTEEPRTNFSGPAEFAVATVYREFVNHAPQVTSPTEVQMFEDEGTLLVYLTAVDQDGDDVIFEELSSTQITGNVSIEPDGRLLYRPCKNCYGIDTVHYRAVDIIQGEEGLDSEGSLTITIHAVNDMPEMLLLPENVDDVTNGHVITLTIGKSSLEQGDGIEVPIMVYDADKESHFQVISDNPQHGTVSITQPLNDVKFVNDMCDSYSHSWEKLRRIPEDGKHAMKVALLCHRRISDMNSPLTIAFSALTYQPDNDNCGGDLIKVLTFDEFGAYSPMYTINVVVICNHCVHGRCVGPPGDKDCINVQGIADFEGYRCVCSDGFGGNFCDVTKNVSTRSACASSPCQDSHICVDQPDGYTCLLRENPPKPYRSSDDDKSGAEYEDAVFPGWQITLIVIGVSLSILVIALSAIYAYKKSKKRHQGDQIPLVGTATSPEDVWTVNMINANSQVTEQL